MYPFHDPERYKKASALLNSDFNIEPQQQPEREIGPFSSLFNWEDEKARQEEMVAKRQEMDQKLSRGNAIVDAFRLITQGVGGSFGATVPKEGPNVSVSKAYDDYRNLDDQMRERLERFRMLELNNLARDLQYQHGLEAEQRGRDFSAGQAELGREFSAGEAEKQRGFTAGQTGEKQAFSASQAEKDRQARIALEKEGLQGQKELEQFRADQGHYSYQSRTAGRTGMYRTLDPQMQTMVNDALVRLYRQKEEETGEIPSAVRAIERNETLKDESIDQLMMDNLDYLRSTIPGFDKVVPLLQQQQPTQQQPTESKFIVHIPQQQFEGAIVNVLGNTSYNYGKKFRLLKKLYLDHTSAGKADAEKFAKELLGEK